MIGFQKVKVCCINIQKISQTESYMLSGRSIVLRKHYVHPKETRLLNSINGYQLH